MIEEIRFQGIKALSDVLVALAPLTVIVGTNSCGKTTLLNEILRVCNMTKHNQNNNLSGFGFEFSKNIPNTTSLKDLDQTWYFKTSNGTTFVKINKYNKIDSNWPLNVEIELSTPKGSMLFKSKEGNLPKPFHPVLSQLTCRAQHLSIERRQLLADSPVDAPTDQLDPSGSGLPTLLLHLAANEPDAYAALQRDLTAVVPDFRRLYVKKVKTSQQQDAYRLDLVFGGAGRIPAEDASEGTLFALALLTALHAPEMPDIVLLDDIDRGLHLSAQYEIVQAIRRVQERRPSLQVICTSHSPVLVDSFRAEEVRVMTLDKQGHACIKPLTELPDYERWKGALRPGELWANFGEQWVAGE